MSCLNRLRNVWTVLIFSRGSTHATLFVKCRRRRLRDHEHDTRQRNAVRPCRTAADAGLLRPDLHFLVALDVKAEVIQPDCLFLRWYKSAKFK